MNLNALNSAISRVLSLAAFLLVALAVAEWLANAFGYTMLGLAYKAGRLMEFAAIFAIFVITILLRQVREELRKSGGR